MFDIFDSSLVNSNQLNASSIQIRSTLLYLQSHGDAMCRRHPSTRGTGDSSWAPAASSTRASVSSLTASFRGMRPSPLVCR